MGREREAERNDGIILAAAREVFIADPKAPIAAVADRAGVGISALYRRYQSKEGLLRKLCHDGLRLFIAEAEKAGGIEDGWAALEAFLTAVVDADVHSLTVHLAGTFASTPEMIADAVRSGTLVQDIVARAHETGQLRPDARTTDIALVLEGCAAIRLPDPARTQELRRRYLALNLDGLRVTNPKKANPKTLPGPAAEPGELNWRWAKSRQPAGRDGDA